MLRGRPLPQKDLHDTLRRVAIPEFGTFCRLTVAVQFLNRLELQCEPALAPNLIVPKVALSETVVLVIPF
jgi:hypothetical protein